MNTALIMAVSCGFGFALGCFAGWAWNLDELAWLEARVARLTEVLKQVRDELGAKP